MKKNELENSEHNNVCESKLLEPKKGSGFDSILKLRKKVENRIQETYAKNRKSREFLEMKNVLTITEDISLNHIEFDEIFLDNIDTLLMDYILTEFTIKELYIFTLSCQEGYIMSEVGFRLAKQQAIEIINSLSSLSAEDKKRMKRKVWDINYILFGLIVNFVHRHEIFDGTDEEMDMLIFD